MKKFLLATVALVALGATVPALAADLAARPIYTKAPAYAAPIYNWTGFYIGGHIGGAFSGNNNFGGLATGNNNNGRFLGGVQVGADYQFAPNWVIGVEGQYSWLGSNNNNAIVFPGGFAYTNNQRGLGSVTGRIGYTWGPALLYVKGGYAYSDNNESRDPRRRSGRVRASTATTQRLHRRCRSRIHVRPELVGQDRVQYYDFGTSRFIAPAALAPFGNFRTDDHTVKAGLNYRFNWGGPVVARY